MNAPSVLTLTISNPNGIPLNNVTVSDGFPNGLVVANPTGAGTTCTGGTFSPNAGDQQINLTGSGTAPANGSCTVTVNVTSVTPDAYPNTTGPVSSSNGGTGGTSNQATLTVLANPTITKSFSPTTIGVGSANYSTLTLTISNSNSTALTGVAVTDNLIALQSGLQVANPTGVANTCGGTFNPAVGDTSINLTGGTAPANGSCTCK